MRRPHRIPLARRAATILRDLQAITGAGKLVSPCVRATSRPISENTLNAALRRLDYGKDEATAHGFHATASTFLNQSLLWHPDVIERQLAHVAANVGEGGRKGFPPRPRGAMPHASILTHTQALTSAQRLDCTAAIVQFRRVGTTGCS